MAIKQVQVDVSEQAYILGGSLVRLVAAIKEVSKDGFQMADVTALVTAFLTEVQPIIKAVSALPAEEKENVKAFVQAFELQIGELVKVLLA